MNLAERWQALIVLPLDFVGWQALEGCFVEVLPADMLQAIHRKPRFTARLEQMVIRHYQLSPLTHVSTPLDADLAVLLLDYESFSRLPRLCGAIWHSTTLSREIRREAVNELRESLGHEVFAQALANRHLSGAADLLREPAELIAAIDRDGQACVSAWFQSQSAELQAWLRLRFTFPLAHNERLHGELEIVQTVAAEMIAGSNASFLVQDPVK